MKQSLFSGQRRARRRDHLNPIVAELPVTTTNAQRRGAASRQVRADEQPLGGYRPPSASGRWAKRTQRPDQDDGPVEEECGGGSIRSLLFKWLIVPVVILFVGWLYRIELLYAARILEHSVAWGVLSILPVVIAWGIWKVARCLWGRGYKRAAFLSGTSGCVMIGYIALNIVAPFVCDKAIDAALRRMPPPGAQVAYAKRGAGYERVILPLDRRINADEIRQSALFPAVPSIEDERFFGRWTGPIDAEALLRASVQTFVWKKQQGGSTILVQAAKLAQGKFRSSLGDKPYQFLMALRLNQRFPTDEEQLALYLNFAQLDGPHGVAYAASNFYGVANLSELKLTEPSGIAASALLAGMLKEPPKYHPRRHPQNALDRRNLVLREIEAGVFEDLTAMQALPLNVRESPRVTTFDFFARAQRRNNG